MLVEEMKMSIVKFRRPNGTIYAYDYSSEIDPVTHKYHQIRKYLGRFDEETGKIINTGGRRGRRPKNAPKPAPAAPSSLETLQQQYQQKCWELDNANRQIKHMQAEIDSLTEQVSKKNTWFQAVIKDAKEGMGRKQHD